MRTSPCLTEVYRLQDFPCVEGQCKIRQLESFTRCLTIQHIRGNETPNPEAAMHFCVVDRKEIPENQIRARVLAQIEREHTYWEEGPCAREKDWGRDWQ